MSEYIKKSEIPPCNCPIPVNPVIPVTPDTPPINPMIPAEVTDPKEIQMMLSPLELSQHFC